MDCCGNSWKMPPLGNLSHSSSPRKRLPSSGCSCRPFEPCGLSGVAAVALSQLTNASSPYPRLVAGYSDRGFWGALLGNQGSTMVTVQLADHQSGFRYLIDIPCSIGP